MFAKPKLPSFASLSAVKARGATFDVRALVSRVSETFQRPYVAPVAAFGAFVVALAAFLSIAADPDAGSPSVRINLPKAQQPAPPAPDDTAGPNEPGFTVDGAGNIQDATINAFPVDGSDSSGTAVITMPGDDSTPIQAAAPHGVRSPLPQAPIAGLVQTTNQGPLPMIAPSGQTPANAYARPFRSDGRPMVALVVGGLGLNRTTTQEAIDQLPPEVTLSFVPYSAGLQGWIDLARASGHEVMIEVPMQPNDYPDNDPGPQTLMANAKNDDLLNHLAWVMSRASGYFAVANYEGSAFLRDRAGASTFLDTLKQRGVAFIDDGQARGLGGAWARATADRVIDSQINAQAIQTQLAGLESTAKTRGQALGTGFGYPVTLAVALAWTQSLDKKGIQLAPASAVLHQ